MKVGFLAYSYVILEKYWNKLKDKADCWWGVPEERLYSYLKENNMRNVVHHHEEHVTDHSVEFANKYISVDPVGTLEKIVEEISPDMWIADTSNNLNFVPNEAYWIQTFHSLPIKKHFFFKPVLEYDLILLPGEYHKEEFIRRLDLRPNDARLKVVGWPRVDDLINAIYDREAIMKEIGLDPGKKTVMYAPTWGWGYSNDGLFARWFGRETETFEKLCQDVASQGLNFIVRLHHLSLQNNNEELQEIAEKYNVLLQVSEVSNFQEDPNKFLWITDILISDLSGIIAEFMVLDRPIIYIDPDEGIEPWSDSDMPKHFRAGHVVQTPEELYEAVNDSALCPERYSGERKSLISKLFYNLDGKATDRAAEAILDFAASKGLK
jgi:CDP-glycerol glycerophosphotransferase (TagB/SpsB family)